MLYSIMRLAYNLPLFMHEDEIFDRVCFDSRIEIESG